MTFIYPFMTAIQEISARIGRVTGRGISANLRRCYPRWLLYVILGLLLFANVINLGADIGAMAAALNLMMGGPYRTLLCALRRDFLSSPGLDSVSKIRGNSEMDDSESFCLCRHRICGADRLGQSYSKHAYPSPFSKFRVSTGTGCRVWNQPSVLIFSFGNLLKRWRS